MARTVELRADLAELGGDEFVMIRQRILAEGASGRRSRNGQRPPSRTESGNLAVKYLPTVRT